MLEFIAQNCSLIVETFTICSFMGMILFFSHRRLRADMNKYEKDMTEIKQDIRHINIRIDATNKRIDDMGKRIDAAYELMIGMMKELKEAHAK